MSIIVGIPAFNEEKNIAALIIQLKKITDKIIDEGGDSHGQYLAGQIKSELEVPHKILEEEGLMGFFNEMTRQFVVQQTIQQKPLEEERILQEEYITEMLSMWIIFILLFC